MKRFSTSLNRWQLPAVAWRSSAAIAAFLAIALLLLAISRPGWRSRLGWTKPSASAALRVGQVGADHRLGRVPGSPNRGDDDSAAGVNPRSDRRAEVAAANGDTRVEAENGTASLHAASSAEGDGFLFSAIERLERQVAAAIALARESVVALEYTAADEPAGTRRIATGVVINQRGELLSIKIDPVVPGEPAQTGKNSAPILARDHSGRRLVAHWVAADPETGLTLLRIAPRIVRPIRVAIEGPKLAGQIFVLGNPFGMGHSVSRGHIAGLDWAMELGDRQLGGMIQIQAPLYPGDSGAAVVDVRGDLLGLVRSGLAVPYSRSPGRSSSSRTTDEDSPSIAGRQSTQWTGVDTPAGRLEQAERDNDFGFAISARDALWIAEQLHVCGRVDRAYLGVRLEGAVDEFTTGPSQPPTAPEGSTASGSNAAPAMALNSSPGQRAASRERGVQIEVLPETPAAESGLRTGDRIVSVDGRPIRSAHELTDRLDRILARTTIQLGVIRGHVPHREKIFLSLRTGSRPTRQQVAQAESPKAARQLPVSSGASTSSAGVPVTTASASSPKPADTSASVAMAPASASSPPTPPSVAVARPDPPANSGSLSNPSTSPSAPLVERTTSPAAELRPDDLRLTLPRAVVERLEQLERRLEKLESPSRDAKALTAKQDRQIGSVKNP